MRSTPVVAPVVALLVLLACVPGRAVELIDLQPTAQPPAQAPGQVLVQQPAYPAPYLPLPPYSTPYFPPYFPPYLPAQTAGYLSADEWADVPSSAVLPDLPLSAETLPPAAMRAAPMPVPEPVSVLMLACGLLLMVPGAWAARWSRLGDSESLLQRRLP